MNIERCIDSTQHNHLRDYRTEKKSYLRGVDVTQTPRLNKLEILLAGNEQKVWL